MTHKMKSTMVIMAILGLTLLAACSSATPTVAPTADLSSVRTEAAATVLARVTQELALTPTETPVPTATAISEPTNTPQPTQAPTIAATAAETAAVTETAAAVTDNKAKYVSQSVPDGTVFQPGETFTMTWRIQNVGITTWKPTYMLRFYSGNNLGAPEEVPIDKEVPPGQTIDITLDMTAPTTPGEYRSVWVMATDARGNFKEPVYLVITVPAPETATPTSPPATATATPTTAPTATSGS
jgi:hypothetical protein